MKVGWSVENQSRAVLRSLYISNMAKVAIIKWSKNYNFLLPHSFENTCRTGSVDMFGPIAKDLNVLGSGDKML